MLVLANTSCAPSGSERAAISWTRSATRTASIGSRMSSISITNSSPPKRASVFAPPSVSALTMRVTVSSCRTALASRSANAHQQLVAGGVSEAVVDVLEAIEVDEEHREAVLRMSRPSRHRALEPFHEQHAVGQQGQRIVDGVVNQALMREPQAGAHLVERVSHGPVFRAPTHGQLERQVAAGDIRGGRRDVAQRPADTAAEHHAADERQAKHHQAAGEETPAEPVDEPLCRLPVGEQQQPPAVRVVRGLPEREDAADILVVADAADLREHAEVGRRHLRDQPRRIPVRRVLQAAGRDLGPGNQDDLALRQSRQFLGQGVGEPVTDRQRAEHLVGKASRNRHGEKQLAAASDDGGAGCPAARGIEQPPERRRRRRARIRPARVGQPVAVGVGDDDEVRVELDDDSRRPSRRRLGGPRPAARR